MGRDKESAEDDGLKRWDVGGGYGKSGGGNCQRNSSGRGEGNGNIVSSTGSERACLDLGSVLTKQECVLKGSGVSRSGRAKPCRSCGRWFNPKEEDGKKDESLIGVEKKKKSGRIARRVGRRWVGSNHIEWGE